MWARILFAAGLLAGAVAVCAPGVLAQASPAAAPGSVASPAEALKDYEVGKRAYDAGDYEGARRAFAQAIRHEPGNARWHYNLGLALRQLDQPHAAREALLTARRLDPAYKRAEIDDKLASMGFDARDPGAVRKAPGTAPAASGITGLFSEHLPSTNVLANGILVLVVAVVAAFLLSMFLRNFKGWLPRRSGAQPHATGRSAAENVATPPDPARLEAQSQRLMRLSAMLVPAEHAMRQGEDKDLRALLERATRLEHDTRAHLAAARAGDGDELDRAASLLDAAEPIAQQLQARAQALGADAATRGERVGCYFCARPLANADYRRRVPLSSKQGNAEVLACPPCAERIDRGETPEITILGGPDGPRHWSEDPGFDPYLHRHAPPAAATQVPAWRFTPSRPIANLAMLAAGGALGAAAAYAATRAFDLDAARASGLAEEAARAAARNAAERSGSEGRSSGMRDSS